MPNNNKQMGFWEVNISIVTDIDTLLEEYAQSGQSWIEVTTEVLNLFNFTFRYGMITFREFAEILKIVKARFEILIRIHIHFSHVVSRNSLYTVNAQVCLFKKDSVWV